MGGVSLPPLAVQDNLAPGVLVVDIGIAQRSLKMPGPDLAASGRRHA